ncbi:MAG TPA: hypothetical protein VD846_00880 [Allosphingosinicella sp.]|nr:hypothetical protein [Allosphingosinicella sp.]
MSRLLTLMMIFVLVLAHGSSVAAAVCRHQSDVEHAAALRSEHTGISAAAAGEETARKAASRQGTPVDSGAASLMSDMLPLPALPVPFPAESRVDRARGDDAALVGATVRPLLEPPSV